MIKYIYICIALSVSGTLCKAQYSSNSNTYELYIFGGGSYYIGDLNPTAHFRHTEPAVGLGLRYIRNPRFAHRIGFWYGNLYGDDGSSHSDVLRVRNLNFQTYVLELTASTEFNFVPFSPGDNDYSYFTPYIFGGIGVFHYDPVAYLNGDKYHLQNLRTEGKKYNLTQLAIPFGFGFKWALSKHLNISLEWGLRKTYTDYIDDVSTVYPDPTTLGSAAAIALSNRIIVFNDINATPTSYVGRQRGDSKNKDWYSFTGIMLNIKLPSKEPPCPGVNNK